jgi:hypothetical protein
MVSPPRPGGNDDRSHKSAADQSRIAPPARNRQLLWEGVIAFAPQALAEADLEG